MRHAVLVTAVALAGCAGSQLQRTGDAMVRVERSAAGVVDGVVAAKDVVKDECVAKQLATEAERAACVEDILGAVKGSRAAIQGVKAALVSFWTLYPILEAKVARGDKVTAADLAELVSKSDAVVAAYRDLIKYARDAR